MVCSCKWLTLSLLGGRYCSWIQLSVGFNHTTLAYHNTFVGFITRNSSGDEIPKHDVALFCYPSCFIPPMEGFPWDDLCKILHGGQRMAKVQNGEEILPKVTTPWVQCTNVTDDTRICDSKDPNVVRKWLTVCLHKTDHICVYLLQQKKRQKTLAKIKQLTEEEDSNSRTVRQKGKSKGRSRDGNQAKEGKSSPAKKSRTPKGAKQSAIAEKCNILPYFTVIK